ncbi:hypothetical protein DMN91_009796 [Ooceraea biroi]|uniref:Monocarboxylate transporter n=1 Tax=Ooceraea biroi TaxID=2015173 RepID=A0A3L8DAN7_OOCBI|nr:hypothetical protein DMN91_009796 [Ooceraea biroi]
MGVLDAIVNFSGFLVGPLLKKYSYRQVAFFGSFISCIGLILTSRANSMLYIICTYSILGASTYVTRIIWLPRHNSYYWRLRTAFFSRIMFITSI